MKNLPFLCSLIFYVPLFFSLEERVDFPRTTMGRRQGFVLILGSS